MNYLVNFKALFIGFFATWDHKTAGQMWLNKNIFSIIAHLDIYSALYLNYTALYVMFIQLKSLWLELVYLGSKRKIFFCFQEAFCADFFASFCCFAIFNWKMIDQLFFIVFVIVCIYTTEDVQYRKCSTKCLLPLHNF